MFNILSKNANKLYPINFFISEYENCNFGFHVEVDHSKMVPIKANESVCKTKLKTPIPLYAPIIPNVPLIADATNVLSVTALKFRFLFKRNS